MAKTKETKKEVVEIQLTKILPDPNNTRSQINEVADNELAQSIRSKGVVQPIGLRPCTDQKGFEYYVIFGHRRLRASKIAGLKSIPAVIIDVTIEDAKDLQLLENLHRLDPHPMDEAIAFHEMYSSKKCSFSDIAKTFGKSEYYIKQRIKLAELSQRFQKLFLKGQMDLITALKIATKGLEVQEVIWNDLIDEDDLEDENFKFQFHNHVENKYKAILEDATFDITDKKLVVTAGACTSCQFNSTISKLFANEEKAFCNNIECFQTKNNVAFKKNLEVALAEPGVILISVDYDYTKESTDLLKKLDGVYASTQFSVEDEPSIQDRSWFDGDYDTEEEDEVAYQEALVEYNEEMKQYKESIEKGEFIKGFWVNGKRKGGFAYVSLSKSFKKISGNNSDDANENNSTEAIEAEIERLESKEKRSKQIDENKIWSALKPAFEPKDFAYNGDELTAIERKAVAKTIYNKLGYYARNSFRDKFNVEGDEIVDVSEVALNSLLRFFFVNELPPAELYNGYSADAKICLEIANEYFPDKLSLAQLEQNDITNIRVAKVEKRIADLKSKL